MLSLLSTLGGLLVSGLPKLIEYFQDRQDKKHELEMAAIQTQRELELAAKGFAAQQRIEEVRLDQIALQTDAQMTTAALDHDKAVLAKASTWVSNYVGTVRPTITYIFVLELVAINAAITWFAFTHPGLVTDIDSLIKVTDVVFNEDEMAMLGGIIGFWFGSRSWSKKK